MADIYLGPSGSETLLPPVNWIQDSEPELPIGLKKNIEKQRALDGSLMVNISEVHLQDFSLEWAMLPLASVLILQGLAALNEPLRYQNNWVDSTWRWVVIENLDVTPIQSTFAGGAVYYKASMTFFEVSA